MPPTIDPNDHEAIARFRAASDTEQRVQLFRMLATVLHLLGTLYDESRAQREEQRLRGELETPYRGASLRASFRPEAVAASVRPPAPSLLDQQPGDSKDVREIKTALAPILRERDQKIAIAAYRSGVLDNLFRFGKFIVLCAAVFGIVWAILKYAIHQAG